jgi:hypothetical protein
MADGRDSKRGPVTDRQASRSQARANADAARETRKSHRPGVDDDSEVVESLVGTLAAPVEGALDSATDVPRDGEARPGKVPTKPEDAEADPLDIAEDMTRDRPGARGRR